LKLIETSKKVKEKKPRTEAQKAATARMLEAKKAKREAREKEMKEKLKQEVEGDIANQVQEEIVRIIHNPVRTLTPERVKKVEEYTVKATRKNRFS